ncbi:MAG: sugar ABC transporter permease [Clostridiaceae bacterium]|nr:sugar ABC transporter permease [Clostridiaceae bacterium]
MFKNIRSYFQRTETAAWVLLFPSLLCLTIFLFIPLIMSFGLAFFDVTIFLKQFKFVGLDNFIELLQDDRFWNALGNTVYFTIMVVPCGILFSLAVALFVQGNSLFQRFLRVSYYVPVICSMTAMGIVWAVLMDPTIGMFAFWIRQLGFENVQLLKDPNLAMPLIAAMTIWKTFGQNMIILVAGLQAIPDEYYDASMIDGANKWKQFFHITLPSLIPTLGFCVTTSTISSFMVFDQTYVMTRGGPLFRTETLAQYVYTRGFVISPFRLGYASSVAFVLFIVIAAISIAMYYFFTKKETEGL